MKGNQKIYKKNRTVIGIVCIALAAVVVLLLNPVFSRAFSARTEIVRLRQDVAEGTKIEKSMLQIVEVGKYGLPENVITNIDDVVGQYAAADLFKDDYILPDKVIPQLTTAELMFAQLDGTRQAMSLSISDFANGMSGKLQGGDIISIIVTDSVAKTSTILPELKYVQVVSATTATGIDTDDYKNLDDDEDNLPASITVLVSETQAEILAKYNRENALHFALVCRRDNKNAEAFLKEQDKFLGITTTMISAEDDKKINDEEKGNTADNNNENKGEDSNG